jgi:glycerate dehydrogenase
MSLSLTILDAATLGADIGFEEFKAFGNVTIYSQTMPDETLDRVKTSDIVITNKVVLSKDILEKSPRLKLVCIAATGMNNVDLNAANALNIEVKNVSGYSTESVVQSTFSHVLYLLNQHAYYDIYAKHDWQKSSLFTHIGPTFYELCDKQWGIIGMGTIGRRVAEVAKAFGAKVVYYSTSGKNTDAGYEHLSLEELLSTSQIITIHAPLNQNTKGLINAEKLRVIQEGSVLVNMGRGGIINEGDLSETIDERRIYFGLDVMAREPITPDHPLLDIKHHERLSLTPHMAWTSVEARHRLLNGIKANIETFIETHPEIER